MLEASRKISPVLEVTLVMSRQDDLELDDVALRERGLDNVRENAATFFLRGLVWSDATRQFSDNQCEVDYRIRDSMITERIGKAENAKYKTGI